jgi:hypothetical protein
MLLQREEIGGRKVLQTNTFSKSRREVMKKFITRREVLMTLGIIGVFAAMIIPDLLNIQEVELRSAWNKVYSEINQATIKLAAENGGSLKGLWTVDASETHTSIMDNYSKHLNFIKKCEGGQAISSPNQTDQCWHSTSGDLVAHFMNGTILTDDYGGNYGYASGGILSNGALVLFWGYENITYCPYSPLITTIYVDVNGYKGPNIVGKDIFRIYVLENSIKPYGTAGDTHYPMNRDCTASGDGFGCSAKYLYKR